jgi:hypothetical protein
MRTRHQISVFSHQTLQLMTNHDTDPIGLIPADASLLRRLHESLLPVSLFFINIQTFPRGNEHVLVVSLILAQHVELLWLLANIDIQTLRQYVGEFGIFSNPVL